MKNLIITILFIPVFFTDCKSQKDKAIGIEYENGKISGNLYSNDLLGFDLTIDTPWILLNKMELLDLIKERVEQIESLNANKVNANINKGIKVLLSLTIDSLQTMPHVMFNCLSLDSFPNLKTESDFLNDYSNKTKSLYQGYDVNLTFSEITTEIINNKTYFTTTLVVKSGEYIAYQKEYSIKLGNKLLNIMTNYNSDYYSYKCRDLLHSIKWK